MREKVRITQARCWSCRHLIKKGLGRHDYRCIRNKVIPEYVKPFFADKCADYKPTRKEAQKK